MSTSKDNGLGEILKVLTQDLRYCQVAGSALQGFCRLNSPTSAESVAFNARELRNACARLVEHAEIFSDAVENLTKRILEENGKEKKQQWQNHAA